jgi:uncharacterized protein
MKFLPQRAPIEAFGDGGFRFAGMSHRGALLVLPSGMRAWRPQSLDDATAKDFREVLAEKDATDFLLIGTGAHMQRLPADIARALDGEVRFDAMSTSAAIHTYNVVIAEGRRYAAALFPVA